MKSILSVFLGILVTVSPLAAQEETLFSGDVEFGGFGGPVVKCSQINNKNALLVGGRGGWIIDHRITIGGGGYGLVTKVPTISSQVDGADAPSLGMGYGGLEVGYVYNSDRLIHPAFHAKAFDHVSQLQLQFLLLSLSLLKIYSPHEQRQGRVFYRVCQSV